MSDTERPIPVPAPTPADAGPPTGLLVVDKPIGWSSMDVCRRVRRRLVAGGAPKRVKVGHGGTLDPLASGVLVVLTGRATKLCDAVMAGEKEYIAEVVFGATSETDDAEGPVTATAGVQPVEQTEIERTLAERFVGTIMQRPPAHSAMKVGGRRAYALARAGKPPVLEPRPIEIHEVELACYDWPRATIRVRCGKGTYVRSLARDLGGVLGVGAYLGGLRRTRVGRFSIEDAIDPDTLPDVMTQADLSPIEVG